MVGTTLPAVVRVVDLPLGTTVTGTELFEAIQTSNGVAQSVQLSLSQMVTSIIGGLPAGGATGTILNKSSGSNYSTQFSAINTFVNIGTALATTGSATSIVVYVPNQAITSTEIANNAVGTNQVASSLRIASTLSIGDQLKVGGTAIVTGTTILNGGLQVTGTSQFTGLFSVAGTSAFTGTVGVAGTALFTSGTFGVVGTSLFTGSHGVVGTALFTSGLFGVVGTSAFTGNVVVYPASNIGFDVNYNTGTFGVPNNSTSYIRILGANGAKAAVAIQGFGDNVLLALAASEGTLQSPTAKSANTVVGSIGSFPYNGATYNAGPLFQIVALNAQTATDASGYFRFQVVATGSTTRFESVRFQASGGVSIGTTTDPGIGMLTVNSGILVASGTTLFTTSFGVVGTAVMTGVHNVVGTALFTSGNFGVVGTSLFTSGAFGVVGTANFTGTFILGSQGAGLLAVSATGVVTATTVAAGSFVLLNTLTPNNVASSNDTTSMSSTYRTYMVTFDNVCPATQTTTFQMQVATTGTAFVSTSYVSLVSFASGLTTPGSDTSNTAYLITGTRSTTQMQTSTVYGLSGFIKIFHPTAAASRVYINGQVSFMVPGGVGTSNIIMCFPSGFYDGANAITGMNFLFSSGNIQTGTIKVYGIV